MSASQKRSISKTTDCRSKQIGRHVTFQSSLQATASDSNIFEKEYLYSSKTNEHFEELNKDEFKSPPSTIKPLIKSLLTVFKSVLFFSLVFGVTFYFYWKFPTPIDRNDSGMFSEVKARRLATYMTEDIGKRIVGSKANDITVDYILKNLEETKSRIDLLRNNEPYNQSYPEIEIEVQHSSGAHVFSIMGAVLTNVYSNISNIIVRVSFSEEGKKNAVLLNAHFDTTIGTPGATDATVPVSVLMEVFDAFVTGAAKNDGPLFQNSVIFLLNGAEESLQEGSHAFITTHRWADTIQAVLNLDACGGGGKEIVFQASSSEIAYAYARSAPHPHGCSVANDVFATGLIQSDTDYRVFKQYKKIVGLDMAYYRNSFVYHTSIDTMDAVETGAIQHTGDNILEVMKELSRTQFYKDNLHTKYSHTQYFDVFGMFMISYSNYFASILHLSSVAIFSFLFIKNNYFLGENTVFAMSFSPILISLWSVTLSFIAAILGPAILAFVVSKIFGKVLLWFNSAPLAWAMYGLTSLASMILVQSVFFTGRNVRKIQSDSLEWLTLIGVNIFYGCFLTLFTLTNRGSSFVFFLWFVCLSLMIVCNYKPSRAKNQDENGKIKHSSQKISGFSYMLAFAPPAIVTMECDLSIADVFLPLTGRLGPVPSDVIVSIILGALTAFTMLIAIPIAHRAGNVSKLARLLVAIILAIVVWSMLFKFPFDQLHPKRMYAQHTYIVHPHPERKENNGELIRTFEPDFGDQSLLVISTADSMKITPELLQIDFEKEFSTKTREFEDPSFWDSVYPYSLVLTSGFLMDVPHHDFIAPSLKLLEDVYDKERNVRKIDLEFTFEGNEWCTLKFKGNLTKWSLTEEVPSTSEDGYYILRHVGSHGTKDWKIIMEFTGSDMIDFDISASHFVYTPSTAKLLTLVPEWITPTVIQTVISKVKL